MDYTQDVVDAFVLLIGAVGLYAAFFARRIAWGMRHYPRKDTGSPTVLARVVLFTLASIALLESLYRLSHRHGRITDVQAWEAVHHGCRMAIAMVFFAFAGNFIFVSLLHFFSKTSGAADTAPPKALRIMLFFAAVLGLVLSINQMRVEFGYFTKP